MGNTYRNQRYIEDRGFKELGWGFVQGSLRQEPGGCSIASPREKKCCQFLRDDPVGFSAALPILDHHERKYHHILGDDMLGKWVQLWIRFGVIAASSEMVVGTQ